MNPIFNPKSLGQRIRKSHVSDSGKERIFANDQDARRITAMMDAIIRSDRPDGRAKYAPGFFPVKQLK
ncbi:MAG: hypothetical protein PHW41_05750 [Eubacteriales bacterium]|nr:hypothetical protein [Eubacteriales bacterium]